MMLATSPDAWCVLPLAGCLFGAAILAQGARHKLRDPAAFAAVLHDYGILPGAIVGVGARLLPVIEIGLAILLLLPPLRPVAALAAAALFAVFAAAILINLARGRRHIACGCGDPAARRPISAALAVANLLLAVLMLATLLLSPGWPGPAAIATSLFAAASAWLLMTAQSTLAVLPRRVIRP